MEDIDIGHVLMLHRKHGGLSRLELAEIAGVGKTVIYDIEHGKETVQFSSLKIGFRLKKYFGLMLVSTMTCIIFLLEFSLYFFPTS